VRYQQHRETTQRKLKTTSRSMPHSCALQGISASRKEREENRGLPRMGKKKRERLEVIRDVLKAIQTKKNIKPTRLLYASNLSPQMFKDYINELVEKKFMQIDIDKKEKKTFSLTKKGYDFLQEYKTIENFVENFGL